MITPLRERMLQERELEHERIQSEIRKNDAEAKKMEAEADSCKRTKKDIVVQYVFSAFVGGIIIVAFTLDTFKNLYDVTTYKIKENVAAQERLSGANEKLKDEKKKFQDERIKFNKELLDNLSRFSQQYSINIDALELLEMELDAYSALISLQNNKECFTESLKPYKEAQNEVKEQIKRIKKIEGNIRHSIQIESNKIKGSLAENN